MKNYLQGILLAVLSLVCLTIAGYVFFAFGFWEGIVGLIIIGAVYFKILFAMDKNLNDGLIQPFKNK